MADAATAGDRRAPPPHLPVFHRSPGAEAISPPERVSVFVAKLDVGKTYRRQGDGTFEKVGTSVHAKSGRWLEAEFGTHADILAVLAECQEFNNRFLVPGGIIRQPHVRWQRAARLLYDHADGRKAHIEDVPRRHVCLDIDHLELPSGLTYDDPHRVLEFARRRLPAVFHDCACVGQFSSSAGLTARDEVKAHLFFLVEEPVLIRDMKRLAQHWQAEGFAVDPEAFEPQQPIFTTRPRLEPEGVEDPIGERLLFLDGLRERVALVPLPSEGGTLKQRTGTAPGSRTRPKVQRPGPSGGTGWRRFVGRDWRRASESFLRATLGDGDGRRGYEVPIRDAVAVAVRSGATQGREIQEHVADVALEVCRERDENNPCRIGALKRYVSQEYFSRTFTFVRDRMLAGG